MRSELIQISDYELETDAVEFGTAASELAARVEREGIDGLTRYGFYVDEEAGTAGAVVTFRDPAAWADHHQLVAEWDEYIRFRGTVSLVNIAFVGDLPPELAAGIEQAGIQYRHLGTLASGFVR
jgi:hypothetical protein